MFNQRMEIDNVQKEEPRDKHSEYYIVRFDPFQELIQGELLQALSSSYDFNVKSFVTVYPAYQGGHKTRVIVRSTSNEAFTRLSNEDANLLLPCSSPESRYQVLSQQGMVVFGRRLQPGTEVLVSVKECPWSLNDEFMSAIVKYKGELPSETGTFFGLELKSSNHAKGNSVGSHSAKPSFSWASPTGIFVGLDRLKPLHLDAEEPDYPEPREFQAYKIHLQSVTRRHDPLHIPQKRADKASVQTGQNIVTLVVDVPSRETKLQKSKEGSIEIGLPLDERAVTAETGKGNAKKLLRNEEQIEEIETHPDTKSSEHQGIYSVVQSAEIRLVENQPNTSKRRKEKTNQEKEPRQEEVREEMFRTDLRKMEQRIRSQSEIESTVTALIRQLEEGDRRVITLQKQLRETNQQCLEREERVEILRTDLNEVKRELKNKMMVNEARENELHQQLEERDQQIENLQIQLRKLERQLREKDKREELLQRDLKEMEQQLQNEMTKKESKERYLHKQLQGRDQYIEDIQEKLREMGQQLRQEEEREEIFQVQLKEMERRLKEEETTFNIRLKDKNQQIENLQKQLAEKEEREQRWKEKIKKTETIETWFRDQLIERTQRVSNIQRKLSRKELECREKEEREENLRTHLGELQQQLRERENLQRQVTEMEDRWRNAQRQLAEREGESANLRQQVANLEDKLESQFYDWIIPRDEIQISDITLGAGGWAEVFEGRYCGCSVAVKQMHETIVSPHNQSVFWREIDIASRCRHPCLLQFIGATNDEGIPLYVTELMETSLRQLLEQRPLSKAEISVIALDVAQALNYLHQKKPSPIIHRDISSGNVLLWRQGNRWRGKVSDYGAAKFKEQKMSIGPGCFAYSAPEVNKSSNQTAKIDVYSFGVLLCEMCSSKQFPDPQKRLAQVNMVRDHGLRELVRRCLKTNPRERPDMTEIISELERLR